MRTVNIYKLLIGIVIFSLGYIFLKNFLSENKTLLNLTFRTDPLIIQFSAVGLMTLGLFLIFKSLLNNRMLVNEKNMSKQEISDYKENLDPLTNLMRNLEKIILLGGFLMFVFTSVINEDLTSGRTSIIFWLVGIAPIITGFMKMVTGKGLDILPSWLKKQPATLDGFVDVLRGIVTLIIFAILKFIP